MTTSTHRADTIHIDEQGCKADATSQWLLENAHKAGTHPITANNFIQMLICGQEGFKAIAADLEQAQSTVDLVCWGFDPGMELVRDDPPTPKVPSSHRPATVKGHNNEWPRGETYGALLKWLATRTIDPVKVRLLIWYSYSGGRIQLHMPGFTDSPIKVGTSAEMRAVSSVLSAAAGVYVAPSGKKTTAQARADHCVEWWRWALDKRNAAAVEVCMRDGDSDAIQESLKKEAHQPGRNAGGWGGAITEESLLVEHGTHHQKTVLIDYSHKGGTKAVGYVMGLNSMTSYWDTRAHLFNDEKRELECDKPPGDKTETYERVKRAGGKSAGQGLDSVRIDPYQDYACRIEGQALQCVEANFHSAWFRAQKASGNLKAQALEELAKPTSVPYRLKQMHFFGQTSRVQIVRTQPEEKDSTIKDAYWQATSFARNYLYLENQYFQYRDWVDHLKETRQRYRTMWYRCSPKGPRVPGILHAFIVIPRPENAGMSPRTFDAVKTLGRSDQMSDLDIDNKITGQSLEMTKERDAQAKWVSDLADWKRRAGPHDRMPSDPIYLRKPSQPTRSDVSQDEAQIKEPTADGLAAQGLKVLIGMLVSYDDGTSGLARRSNNPGDRYRQIYIHSKLLLIDDAFFTVGSANLNQRSMAVDSEINLATDDPVKAKALRKDIWTMHTKTKKLDGGNASPSEIADTFEKWQTLMGDNDSQKKNGLPLQGFLCTFRDSKFSKVRYA